MQTLTCWEGRDCPLGGRLALSSGLQASGPRTLRHGRCPGEDQRALTRPRPGPCVPAARPPGSPPWCSVSSGPRDPIGSPEPPLRGDQLRGGGGAWDGPASLKFQNKHVQQPCEEGGGRPGEGVVGRKPVGFGSRPPRWFLCVARLGANVQ